MKRLLLIGLVAVLGGCATQPSTPPGPVAPPTTAIVGEPTSPQNRAKIHTELSMAYFRVGSYAVALQEARTAIAADPSFASAHSALGLVYMALHENRLAAESFHRALEYSPNDPDINHHYGWFLCQTGHEAESIQYFMRAARDPLFRAPQKSYALAGVCEMRLGKDRAAEQDFEHALSLQPNEPVALLHLGELRYREKRYGEARRLAKRFLDNYGPTATSLWLAVRIEHKLGRSDAEAAYASELGRRFPNSPEYHKLQSGDYE